MRTCVSCESVFSVRLNCVCGLSVCVVRVCVACVMRACRECAFVRALMRMFC